MAASAEKIKELLGNGLTNEVVATAVGVHPSYISQLLADETFAAEVVAKRTQNLTAITTRDRTWDGIEDKLIRKLGELIDDGMIYKPTDVLRAAVVANSAKRRGTAPQETFTAQKTVVNLNLPVTIINAYRKNITGEVVEVISPDGSTQTLTTMPAASLMRNLSEAHKGTGSQVYDKVRRFLPSGGEAKDT